MARRIKGAAKRRANKRKATKRKLSGTIIKKLKRQFKKLSSIKKRRYRMRK